MKSVAELHAEAVKRHAQMRAGRSEPVPQVKAKVNGKPQSRGVKIPPAKPQQRTSGNVWKAPPVPAVDCVRHGEKAGQLVCNCQNKPAVYACSLAAESGGCGYCIEAPTTLIVDGKIVFPSGAKSDSSYLPWQVEDSRKPLPGLVRMPVCSLCEYKVPRPTLETLNPESPIQVVTGHTPNYAEMGVLTSATLREYCTRHGYGLRVHTGAFEVGFHPSWSKIRFAQQAFDAGAEVIFWVDADAAVTNQTRTLDTLLAHTEDFILAPDPWGINCGVWLLRRSEWSDRFLATVWDRRNTVNKLWEQDEIQAMLDAGELDGHHRLLRPRLFNSIPSRPELRLFHWQPGDLICHSTGANGGNRLPWLRSAVSQTVR